jgi:hypothetical protein
VTTDARPMTHLVAAVMLATLAALAVEVAQDEVPGWSALASLALAGGAIAIGDSRRWHSA